MGQRLGQGNDAVALLGNSIATGCGLYVLISLLGPISGAHFNPLVSMMFWRLGVLRRTELYRYTVAQISGAIAGVWLAHGMFSLPIIQASAHHRNGWGIWISEFVSTLVLLIVIRLGAKYAQEKIPMLVALTVTAGYWFTSSTFFANYAVTIARGFTDTFVGISPNDVLGFLLAQSAAFLALVFCLNWNKNARNHLS